MKTLILTAALLSAPSAADEFCNQYYEVAKEVMEARQDGFPVNRAWDIFSGTPVGKKMVIQAYTEPQWERQAKREKAIEEFASAYFLSCQATLDAEP